MSTDPRILVLSGPNLGLLGEREPEVYGAETLEQVVSHAREVAPSLGLSIVHHQTDHEGEMVEFIHAARHDADGIIINPGAFTHYAWAVHDALAAVDVPIIELHLSNPHSREAWRHRSVVAPVASAVIAGLGAAGYRLAVEAMAMLIRDR